MEKVISGRWKKKIARSRGVESSESFSLIKRERKEEKRGTCRMTYVRIHVLLRSTY